MKLTAPIRLLALAGTVLSLATSSAPAALTVFGTTSGSAASPPSLATRGMLLEALDFGSDSAFTYQGVTFAPANVNGATSEIEATTPFTVTVSGTHPIGSGQIGNGGSASGLFETEVYNSAGDTFTLTISGLNAANSYEFQFLHGDTRSQFPYNNTTQTFTDSINGESATTQLSFNTTTSNQYTDTVVDASGVTSVTYTMPTASGNSRGPSFSGLEINQVPEPSTWAAVAAGAGLLTLLGRARRRLAA